MATFAMRSSPPVGHDALARSPPSCDAGTASAPTWTRVGFAARATSYGGETAPSFGVNDKRIERQRDPSLDGSYAASITMTWLLYQRNHGAFSTRSASSLPGPRCTVRGPDSHT